MTGHQIHKDVVQTSEDMRRLGRMPIVDQLELEWNNSKQDLKEIEHRLTRYTPTAFVSEQKSIRIKYRRNTKKSYDKWQSRKASMGVERQELLDQKIIIETRMSEIKPKLRKLQSEERSDADKTWPLILDELRQIKAILIEALKQR